MSTIEIETIITGNKKMLEKSDPYKAFQAFVSNFFIDAMRNEVISSEIFTELNGTFMSSEVYKSLKEDIKMSKSKKIQDPAKPKLPPSIYQMFCNHHRAGIKAALEKLSKGGKVTISDVSKSLGSEWKIFKQDAADHPGKKAAKQLHAWEEERAKLKAEYDEKMKEYVPAPGTESSSKKGPAKTDPKMPKRPPSEYLMFGKKHRDEIKKANPDAAPKEITGLIAKAWAEFKEKVEDEDEDAVKEMKSYKKTVKAAKAKFNEEMESYVPSEGYDEKGKLKNTKSETKSKKPETKSKKPEIKSKKSDESDESDESEEDEKSETKSKKKAVVKKPETKSKESDDSSSSEEDEKKSETKSKKKAVVKKAVVKKAVVKKNVSKTAQLSADSSSDEEDD